MKTRLVLTGGETGCPRQVLRVALAAVGLLIITACAPAVSVTEAGSSTDLPGNSQEQQPSPDAPPPTISITCPADEDSQDGARTFGHDIAAETPYTIEIDYGDDRTYKNDKNHLDAIFEHEYSVPGDFHVTASVTDSRGETASDSCDHTWTALGPASEPPPTDGGDDTDGSCPIGQTPDGNGTCVEEPAPAPAGPTALCNDGTYSYSAHRQGTCSHHGGVARWY